MNTTIIIMMIFHILKTQQVENKFSKIINKLHMTTSHLLLRIDVFQGFSLKTNLKLDVTHNDRNVVCM